MAEAMRESASWHLLRGRLHPQARWVRDDERLFLLLPPLGVALRFEGAAAMLLEDWLRGGDQPDALRRVGICHGLGPTEAADLLADQFDLVRAAGLLPPEADPCST